MPFLKQYQTIAFICTKDGNGPIPIPRPHRFSWLEGPSLEKMKGTGFALADSRTLGVHI